MGTVEQTKTGLIKFNKINLGTKSESISPFLIKDNSGKGFRLHYKDDNPFSESYLKQFDGKYVSIKGVDFSTYFLVNEIIVLETPDAEVL